MWFKVFWIVIAMLLIVVLAGLVVTYVAFPYRGEEVPKYPWVGDAMRRGADRLPTLDKTLDKTLDGDREHQRY
jgi:hypothetical protein